MYRFILLTGILLTLGCQLSVTPNSSDDLDSANQPAREHAPAMEVWQALAHAVEGHSITSTTQLTQVVVVLSRNGDLSEKDALAFEAAFPNLLKNARPLTSDDAQRLRGLK